MIDYVAASRNASMYVNFLELAAAIVVALGEPRRRPAWPARPRPAARNRAC
jgi:hypothetical protein